jgi:hypothetical protein
MDPRGTSTSMDIQWIRGCVGVNIHRYPVVVVALEGKSDSRE